MTIEQPTPVLDCGPGKQLYKGKCFDIGLTPTQMDEILLNETKLFNKSMQMLLGVIFGIPLLITLFLYLGL